MSMIKNFSISATSSNIQLGKRGGFLNYSKDTPDGNGQLTEGIQLYQADGKTLSRLQIADPKTDNDAVTKYYVDGMIQGLNLKKAVYVASVPSEIDTNGNTIVGTGNIPLTGSVDDKGSIIIDSVEILDKSRILLKDQTDKKENGIYIITINAADKTYSMSRSEDANNQDNNGGDPSELSSGCFVFVQAGTENADTGWVLSFPVGKVNIGTDEIEWVQFSSAGVVTPGKGLTKSGTTLSVSSDNVTIYIDNNNSVAIKSGQTGSVLISNGSNTAAWGKIDLQNSITNILPSTNGGTGFSTYSSGDILYGNSDSGLSNLSIGGANQVIGIDTKNNIPEWTYVSSLYNTNGILTIKSNSSDTNTSYMIINGSDTGKGTGYDSTSNIINSGVSISNDGTDDDINLTINPKGKGLILSKTGYSSYIQTNYSRSSKNPTTTPLIPDDAIATVGFVMDKVTVPDTTKIYNTDSSGKITASVETNNSNYPGNVIVSSNDKIISDFTSVDPVNGDTAISGEKLIVAPIAGETRLYSASDTKTDDVNLRLIPQAGGYVYLGEKGSGIIKAEDTFSLTLSGGDGNSTTDGADVIVRGGSALSSTNNAGNIVLQGGEPSADAGSTSIGGSTFIRDCYKNNIVNFITKNNNSVNYFQISNSPDSNEQAVSGIHLGVSPNSKSTDVSVYIDTLGKGLLRANNGDSYTTNLSLAGNDNAFVTKKYVDSTVGGATIPDGYGLTTYTENGTTYRSIDFGNSNTVGFDSSWNIVVKSGVSEGLVLLSSSGSGTTTEANWGKIDISSQESITGILNIGNGGTGFSTYDIGDMLYASGTGTLSKLSTKNFTNGQVLTLTGTDNLIPTYTYISDLYDNSGKVNVSSSSSSSPVNIINLSSANSNNNPSLSIIKGSGESDYVGLNIYTAPSGLVYVNDTYITALSDTKNINSNNALVTKQYVDTTMSSGGDPLMVKQVLTTFGQANNIGAPKVAIPNKVIVISQILVEISTVLFGNDVDGMMIYVGDNTTGVKIADISDTDVLSTGIYIKNMDSSVDISGSQIIAYLYKSDGTTLTSASSGNMTVLIKYNILSS